MTAATTAGPAARCSPHWLWLALVGPVGLLAVDASLDEPARLSLLARALYLAPPTVLLLAAVAVWRRWRVAPAPGRAAVALWPGAVAALVLVAVVFAVAPPAMRVQFDESSLVAVSQGMHEQRSALMATGALPFDGAVLRLENTVDKRPPLFPFLVSVAHDLTGARIANAFAVNALLLWLGLLVLFAAVRARLGLVAGLTAPVLVVAVPLSAIVATSAGFELLAVVLFAGVLLAALDLVRGEGGDAVPPTAGDASWLLALGGLFAQARYESLPALAVVLALVAWRARRRLVWTRGRVAFAVAQGWLTAPILVQLRYARDPKFYPEAAGRPLLSPSHLFEHVPPFVHDWFAPALHAPLPGVLAIAGVLAVACRLARRRAGFADLLVALPVAAVTGAVLLWFYGDVREPTALRLFLPAAWLTALLPLAALPLLPRRAAAWLLAAAVALAGLRLAAVARGETFPRLPHTELAAAMERAAAAVDGPPDAHAARHTLWVAATAQHLIVHGRAALSPASFAARVAEVRQAVRDGHVRAILVLTTPFDRAFAPAFGDPADILRATDAEPVHRADGELSVYRIRLR